MKLIAAVILLLAVLALAGCTGTLRVPQCKGPWTPINASPAVADEA